jgi:nitrogenase subunit NifH
MVGIYTPRRYCFIFTEVELIMTDDINNVNNFCRKYYATVGPNGNYQRRTLQVPLKQNAEFYNDFELSYRNIPMLKIVMPEDSFGYLLESQNHIQTLIGRTPESYSGHMYKDIAMQIVEREDAEIRLRNQHPGLKDLYNQYQMMLHLVR